MIIYIVTNNTNGKKYIGQSTKSLIDRKSAHKYDAKAKRTKMYFHNAINTYGIDNFHWQILWEGIDNPDDPFLLDRMERRFMNEHQPEYNLRSGGQNGYRHSEETKQKMANTNNTTYEIATENGQYHICNDLQAYCVANDLSYSAMVRVSNGWANYHKGYTIRHITETKRNKAIENSLKRNKPSGYNLRYINGHTLIKDGVIYEFDHIENFCHENNLSRTAIGLVLKGIRKRHKGYELS